MVVNCSAKGDVFDQATILCGGYISGVADLLSEGDAVCIPAEVDAKRLVEVFVSYSQKHDALLHGPASRLMEDALKDTFPCKH